MAFVDYGNEEDVAAKDLLPMTAELAQEASCCLPVLLDGVPLLEHRAGDLLPKELLTVELVDSGKPPLARLLVEGECINGLAARKDASAVSGPCLPLSLSLSSLPLVLASHCVVDIVMSPIRPTQATLR